MLWSSSTLFSMGVPESATRVCPIVLPTSLMALVSLAPWFLMHCASSITMQENAIRSTSQNLTQSLRTMWYVDRMMSNPRPLFGGSCRCRPWYTKTSRWEAHFANSCCQFLSSPGGTTTSAGRGRPHSSCSNPDSRRWTSKAIACSVLPKPMSSAKTAPRPLRASAASHWNPASWYGRRCSRRLLGGAMSRTRSSPRATSWKCGASGTSQTSSNCESPSDVRSSWKKLSRKGGDFTLGPQSCLSSCVSSSMWRAGVGLSASCPATESRNCPRCPCSSASRTARASGVSGKAAMSQHLAGATVERAATHQSIRMPAASCATRRPC
mmetsp:Transcript_1753/g.5261  ORF Transcript_1753/g.5261 Transcript_1753/m.5261 type:complete len:324 (-) Transcript_1753:779-1750(-)